MVIMTKVTVISMNSAYALQKTIGLCSRILTNPIHMNNIANNLPKYVLQ